MTGAPAETWRKFKFSDSPWWAFWVGGVLLAAATARRASGYLPLTHAGSRSIRLVRLTPLVFVTLMALFWIAAIVAAVAGGGGSTASAATAYFGLFGSFFMVMALVMLLLTHRYGPGGKVRDMQRGHFDHIVELQNVHPEFVTAVRKHQQMRAAEFAALAPRPLAEQPK